MTMTNRNDTNTLNTNVEADGPWDGDGELQKLSSDIPQAIIHPQQPLSISTSTSTPTPTPTPIAASTPKLKPKFLPYITKKPAILQENHQCSTISRNSPANFARIVSPYQKPSLKQTNSQRVASPNTRPDAPVNVPLILQLPLDIWHIITPNLPQSTIAALSRTHSSLHDLLLPILYHDIDLTLSFFLSSSNPDTNKYRSRAPLTLLIKAQYIFIKQIISHPKLAFHVKSLRWTLGVERHGLLPHRIQGQEVVWSDEQLFTVFELMKEVRIVDIGVMLRSHGFPSGKVLSHGLFPHAHSIKLEGIMKRKLVLAILHPTTASSENAPNGISKGKQIEGKTTQLKYLHLDDLQEESAPSTISATQRAININSVDLPRLGSIQPMQHILTPSLHSRCLNLHHLHIKVFGMSERGTSDDELWAEWAVFIKEVKPKEVVFDCDRLLKKNVGERPMMVGQALRVQRGRVSVANDRRFGETLLPVLTEGWMGLERVEVRGVGESVVMELESLTEKGVEVGYR